MVLRLLRDRNGDFALVRNGVAVAIVAGTVGKIALIGLAVGVTIRFAIVGDGVVVAVVVERDN